MSPEACPHAEEFSALLDRELAPERIPTLERHVGECESCRKLFLRLAAADRMYRLVLGRVDLLAECLEAKPEKEDAPTGQLLDDIEAFGRNQRAAAHQQAEERTTKRKSRRRMVLFLLFVLAVGGFAGALQPSPVTGLSGKAKRAGAYVTGPGVATLHGGAKLKLSDGARARFTCAFRWQKPTAELSAGTLEVKSGKLVIRVKGVLRGMIAGQAAVADADGKVTFKDAPKPLPGVKKKPPATETAPPATPPAVPPPPAPLPAPPAAKG